MGGSHSDSIKIATINYSGITDSPFEFESIDTPELSKLNQIFKQLFHQMREALNKHQDTIPKLRRSESAPKQIQPKSNKEESNKKKQKIPPEDNPIWRRFEDLGKATNEQIKSFMKKLNPNKEEEKISKREVNPNQQQILEKFDWGINQLDKNMHKGRYCPQYRENVGILNGRFNSMAFFFTKWKLQFEKNKAYSKLQSQSSKKQRNVCMVYDYIIYKTLVEYCYDEYLNNQNKSQKPNKPHSEYIKTTMGYTIAPRQYLQARSSKPQDQSKQKSLRRAILQKYEQLLEKYHSMPYLKHYKKYHYVKKVIQNNHIIFLQDISDQLLNTLKGEGDLTIANRLGADDDCCIVINNRNSTFSNIYDALKITDPSKRKKIPLDQDKTYPKLLTANDFNYFILQKQRIQKKYVPAVCFIDNFLLLSLRFTSKQERAVQIYKFFDHMIKINKQYPQLFIIVGGDFNTDLTNQAQLKELAQDSKVKKYRTQTQLLTKFNEFKQYFDISKVGKTTQKKRSWIQSQSHKAGIQDIRQRDFLISNHQIFHFKRDGNGITIDKDTKLPSKQHPFDHFFILGEIHKQSPKINRA